MGYALQISAMPLQAAWHTKLLLPALPHRAPQIQPALHTSPETKHKTAAATALLFPSHILLYCGMLLCSEALCRKSSAKCFESSASAYYEHQGPVASVTWRQREMQKEEMNGQG